MNPYYTPYDYFDMPIFDSTFDFNKCTLTTDLYVEEIDKKVGKKGIIDLFSKYGSLHDMTMNLSHPYSKCTAVVKYIYRKDAEQALKQAQYEKLGRYNIVVSFLTDSNGGLVPFKLLVDNIDPTIGLKELHNHFVQGGANILHVKIDTDGQGNSLGTGYVFFETREYFNYALCRLQGSKLKGKELRLSPLLEGIPEIENSDKKFLYVKHLPADKNQDELRKLVKDTFSKYGEIRTMSVTKHPKEDKYSAILQFSDHLHAQEALKDLSTNLKDYGAPEGPLFVAWLQNRTERAQQVKAQHHKPSVESENRVYMKNLRENVTEEDLKYVFKRFGTILNVTCHESLTSDLRKKSCYGVIAYSKAEEACKAVSEALEYSDIRNLYQYHAKPYINLYQSKEEREKCVSIKKLCNAQMNYMGLMNKMWEANKTAFCSAMKQEKPLPVGIYSPFFNLNGENDPSVANREQKNVAKGDQLPQKNHENKQTKSMHDVNKDEIVTVAVKRSPLKEKHTQFVTIKDIQANLSAFTQLEISEQKDIIKNLLLPLVKEIIGEIHASWVLEVITGSENFDAGEVLEWAQEKSSLTRKVSEIMKTLRENKEKNNQAEQGVYCGINVNRLMNYDVDRQKQIVGTLLFPLVRRISGDENAPRVTGMLINESVFEVNSMLSLSKDKVLLEKRVSEAVERIEEEKLLKETSVY